MLFLVSVQACVLPFEKKNFQYLDIAPIIKIYIPWGITGVPGGMGEKLACFHNSLCLLFHSALRKNILEGIRSGSVFLAEVLPESWSEKYRNRQQGTDNRWREPGAVKHQCVTDRSALWSFTPFFFSLPFCYSWHLPMLCLASLAYVHKYFSLEMLFLFHESCV